MTCNSLTKRSKQDVQSSKMPVIWLAMQKDQCPLRLPCHCFLVLDLRMVHSCATVDQSCLGVAKGHLAAQNAIEQA
jgi:hypothetical protein